MVLLDWCLPELRETKVVDQVRAANPACQIVALSVCPEDRAAALYAGVDRFVCKGDAPETLLVVVREVRESLSACGPLAPSNA
jgi:DNA-binding response OmpR family regulator